MEGSKYWRTKKALYQIADQKKEIELLKRRIDLGRTIGQDEESGLKQSLEAAQKKEKLAEAELMDLAATLEDVNQEAVIVKKYVDGKSWEEIAEEMNMNVRQVQKYHGRALPFLAEALGTDE